MLKNILRLLAASTSFVALLLVINSAIATTPETTLDHHWRLGSPKGLASASPYALRSPVVSLNVVSPVLQASTDTLINHFGCSCAACIQIQNTSQI